MIGRTGQPDWAVATKGHQWMHRDLEVAGFVEKDGAHTLDIKNVSRSPVRNLTIYQATTRDRYAVRELGVGESRTVPIGDEVPLDQRQLATFFLKYTTHHGLPHSTFDEVAFRPRR